MMEPSKLRSSRFRNFSALGAVTVSLLLACKTSAKDPTAAEPSPSATPAQETSMGVVTEEQSKLESKKFDSKDHGFDIEMTPAKAPDGGLVYLKLTKAAAFEGKGLKASFEGSDFTVFPVAPGEYGALVAIPFNTAPRQSKIVLSTADQAGVPIELPIEIIDGKYRQEVLKVDAKHVNPPPKALKRILREMKEVGAIYRKASEERYWSGKFQLPVSSVITSPFGNKRLFNGQMKNFHQGLDLRAKVGTEVFAPEAGKVVLAKNLYFSGNCVILDHGQGLYTVYAHLSKLKLKPGTKVKKGQLIALSGNTGRSSGPHLHWGAVVRGAKVNPLDLVRVIQEPANR